MGKKKKKSKKMDPRAVLERAENLFQKGNYLVAEREFVKAAGMIERADIDKKIEICRQEIEKAKAQEIVKRAKKLDASGQARHALECLQEAYQVLKEEWILNKIEQLKDVAHHQKASQEAETAEASGEYLRAAERYAQASENQSREDMVLKQADCLIKAEAWDDSLAALERVSLKGPKQWYNYGFACARAGKFCQCLKAWENIASKDEGFLDQKARVAKWLVSDLYHGFERGEDIGRVYEEGQYLIDAGYARDGLSDLVVQSAFAWIETLWKEKQYESIFRILENLPARDMDMTLLQLRGKIAFKLAERTGESVGDLARYWLSALFSADFSSASTNPPNAAAVRKRLIKKGEDLIRQYAASDEDGGRTMLARWDLEKSAVENLCQLVEEQGETGLLVCTPSLAVELNMSSDLLSFIRKHPDFFDNREQWLLTGCCYSAAWEGLALLSAGECQKAQEALPQHKDNDPFLAYGLGRVLYEYGLERMARGERPPNGYAQSVADLFRTAPEYEAQIADKALDVDELRLLKAWEPALQEIHTLRPSRRLSEALSLVISRRAALMFNEDMLTSKVLTLELKKALTIYPENEHADQSLKDAVKNQEIEELDNLLYRHKMNRACKLARETEYEEVRESFFEFVEGVLDEFEHAASSREESIVILKDLEKWCVRVDPDHDILYDIEEMLEEIEGR